MGIRKRVKEYSTLHLGAYSLFLGMTLKLGGVAEKYWGTVMRKKVMGKLRKKYKKEISAFGDEIEAADASLDHGKDDTVWICWLQGMENAPPIVQACYRSVCRTMGEKRKIVVITRDNYAEYVGFPRFITERFETGIISPALFSDLLRTELLIRYGGTWIDATVFLSGSVPDYMLESDLFMFRIGGNDAALQATRMESWFLSACRNEKILLLAQKLLYLYLEKHKTLADYFIWYDFMELAIERFPAEWENVPPVVRGPCDLLQTMLFEPFRQDVWDVVTANSPVHKLTYRFADIFRMTEQEAEEAVSREGTVYRHISEGFL